MKKYNFSAGPAILPASVMQEAAQAVLDFNGSGLSILEVSHRSKDIIAVMDEAVQLTRDLLGLTDDRYAVLFLSGGASTQFFMTAMNLLNEGEMAAYVDTGAWSDKAIKEAKHFGRVDVLASSKPDNYTYIPKGYAVPDDAVYLHLTSNNTIFGTQYQQWPETKVPFVCDMSSDMFSRPIPTERFGLLYAGAQKNMGPAGVTLVVVRQDLLGRVTRHLPAMLDYRLHIKNESAYNTPPVFPIYVSMLTMRWVQANGGLEGMAAHNEAKAKVVYDEIDRNSLFVGTAAVEDRSRMNATFLLHKPDLEKAFLADCDAAGIDGIKGHRSVGGFRASIYNAMTIEGVQVLADVMRAFEAKHG